MNNPLNWALLHLAPTRAALASCAEFAAIDEINTMNRNGTLIKIAFAVAALTDCFSFSAALPQDSQIRTVEQYTCRDIMRESGGDRDVAIAFLHGFLLGKSGSASFKVEVLHKQTSDFIERCLNNPGERAIDVMSKLKSE
jgi:hypothetical protein